ncbi:hypothetical protein CR513_37619, partial [Mucuna pruriens]
MLQLLTKKKGNQSSIREREQTTLSSAIVTKSMQDNNIKKALEVFANERLKPTIEDELGVNEQDLEI